MIPDYRIIGKRIKNARLAKGMKQEELAEEIDVSVAFLSRIETGRAGINLKRLTQVAEILNVSPGYLLTGSNVESKDYLKAEFSELLGKCTPTQQKLIYKIGEFICKYDIDVKDVLYFMQNV